MTPVLLQDQNLDQEISCAWTANLTGEEITENVLYTDFDQWMYLLVIPSICLAGLVTNVIFLIVVYRIPSMRNTTNFYLGNLACADIMFLVISSAEYITGYLLSPIRNDYIGREVIGCVLPKVAVVMWFYASVLLVSLVTFERYFAICWPFKHKYVSSKKRTVLLTALMWTLALIFSSICIPGFSLYQEICLIWPEGYEELPQQMGVCTGKHSWTGLIFPSTFMLLICLSFGANNVMYIAIVRKLHKRTKILKSQGDHDRAIETRNNVTRMLVINSTVFFICQMPLQVSNLYNLISGLNDDKTGDVIDRLWDSRKTSGFGLMCLIHINCVIHPVIFGLVNPVYRKAFVEALCGKRNSDETLILDQFEDNAGSKI